MLCCFGLNLRDENFPEHSLLIETEKIKLLAEEECAGTLGRKLMQQVRPGDDFVSTVHELEQTEEFRKILSNAEPFPTEAYPDITAELKLLGIRNSVLTLSQVLLISKIVAKMRLVFDFSRTAALVFLSCFPSCRISLTRRES